MMLGLRIGIVEYWILGVGYWESICTDGMSAWFQMAPKKFYLVEKKLLPAVEEKGVQCAAIRVANQDKGTLFNSLHRL